MKNILAVLILFGLMMSANAQCEKEGWISLFDGKTLNGWKASEKPGTFSVDDGKIKVHGKRSHLYYVGPVGDHDFNNFELVIDAMTTKGSNSGVYVHTEFQQDGWPKKGYETQINSTHSDWKKTSSIYDVVNIKDSPSEDNKWFTQHITVKGKHIVIKTDGKTIVDYVEPEFWRADGLPGRRLSHGTICLQGHDPKSVIYYKNIYIKELVD
jgi:hypothetical protein